MAAVPGWLGSYARRRREQTPEAKADLSLSAAWQRQDAEIKRLADAYDAVAEDYSELTARVDALDEKLTEMTRRFWSAIAYVRQLTAVIRRIDPDHNIPDPPDDLEAYL
ncbi:hypothetical protein [Gordonia sp. QH-12]|uniref:hypothetical protein n=1 Tax=unclassified Gordonia (in: high G+C Gram-positive bacteria) TaxID=2657482 RepID=UPI0012E82E86|nr:hypothetical protein [Gordonia sp. QH-12]